MKLYFDKDKKGKTILVVEDAKIFWTNFRGLGSKYNTPGHRNFCLALPKDAAADMAADGWNVKYTKPSNEEFEPEPYVSVNISWEYKKPFVTFTTNGRANEVGEEEIDILDTAEIERVDLALDLSVRTKDDGSTGIKGYVKSMDVVLYEDPIRRRARTRMVDDPAMNREE